jgi:multidrug resistance protein
MRKPSVLIVFLTVCMDLIGFGMIIPLLPIYAKDFHAAGWQIGGIMAAYSLMQFIFSPHLGRLSDRVGRRPVLLISTAGSAISYVILAYGSGLQGSTALLVLLLARAFGGVCAANITVAQAYIADITPPENRSKRMALIGIAFGLGFVFGPFIGAFAREHFGNTGPGWFAAALCAANFLLALAILPESWKPSSEHVARRPHFDQYMHTLGRPKVGLLIGVFFLATFCFTCFEVTLALLLLAKFRIDPDGPEGIRLVRNLFAYAGIVGAVVQGGTGRFVKMMGEPKLIAVSLLFVAASLGALPFANTWVQVYVLVALLSIGSSMTRPPVFGMISNLTSAHEQGVTNGVAQSIGSLARIFGPMFAGILYVRIAYLPYVICAGVSAITALIAWQRLSKDYKPGLAVEAPAVEA